MAVDAVETQVYDGDAAAAAFAIPQVAEQQTVQEAMPADDELQTCKTLKLPDSPAPLPEQEEASLAGCLDAEETGSKPEAAATLVDDVANAGGPCSEDEPSSAGAPSMEPAVEKEGKEPPVKTETACVSMEKLKRCFQCPCGWISLWYVLSKLHKEGAAGLVVGVVRPSKLAEAVEEVAVVAERQLNACHPS